MLALAALVATFAGVLALSPGARGALADWLDFLPGVRVERVDELPSMPLTSWTGVYGVEVTLAEAEERAPFEILLRSRWECPTSSTTTAIRRAASWSRPSTGRSAMRVSC